MVQVDSVGIDDVVHNVDITRFTCVTLEWDPVEMMTDARSPFLPFSQPGSFCNKEPVEPERPRGVDTLSVQQRPHGSNTLNVALTIQTNRLKMNMTQKELGIAINETVAVIKEVENRNRLTVSHSHMHHVMQKLRKFFNLPLQMRE